MGKKTDNIKVKYGKRNTVPLLLNFIPAILGADPTVDEATIEVDGKKYVGTGRSKEEAFQNAMKEALRDRR